MRNAYSHRMLNPSGDKYLITPIKKHRTWLSSLTAWPSPLVSFAPSLFSVPRLFWFSNEAHKAWLLLVETPGVSLARPRNSSPSLLANLISRDRNSSARAEDLRCHFDAC